MGVPTKPLTTTHFALLCLLSVRRYGAYDVVKEMERSVGHVWPRAQSNVYADLKRLAGEGLATASVEADGGRTRTVYDITPAGRRVLREWLETPGAPASFECEALVKLGFVTHTSKAAALAQVEVLASVAEQRLDQGRRLAREHIAPDGPTPERLHVNAVMWRFLWEQHQATARWATWARREISAWPDTADSPAQRRRGRRALRDALASEQGA